MDEAEKRMTEAADVYTERYGIRILSRLGAGKDGVVWASDQESAIKFLKSEELYQREAAVYGRLAKFQVTRLVGHFVSQLIRLDTSLRAIEMTIVSPPFVLDFAGAYLDGTGPVFPDDVMAGWREDKMEQFGRNFSAAMRVVAALRRYGVAMMDVHPGNIRFGNEDQAQ